MSKRTLVPASRSEHPCGAQFDKLDGYAHFIADSIAPATLDPSAHRGGGQPVAGF